MTQDPSNPVPTNPAKPETNRRQFLKTSAFIGASAWAVGRGAWADEAAPASASPNEKLNIACIGIGGKGESDSTHVALYGNVIAICDIDDKRLEKKSTEERKDGTRPFAKAEKFNDYRKMFDKLGKGIDAVTVSTPDHHHAVAAMMAIKLGKHVYCQKPLTRTVAEARALRMAARQYKVCTQMGNQGTAFGELRHGVDILRAGALGAVKEVHVWTNRPVWPQAPQVVARPPETPVPGHVHWEEWIGPAPMRPYAEYDLGNGKKKGAYHDFNWRGWWDFGTGALGVELGYPTKIEAKCGDLNDETYPSWATIVYHFPARGDKPAVKLTWWEGHKPDSKDPQKRNLPSNDITNGFTVPNSGSLCIGDKAMMFSLHDYGGGNRIVVNANKSGVSLDVPKALPELVKTASQIHDPKANYDNDEGQKAEWFAAIRAGKAHTALSNFDYAGMLTEFLLLGNIAIKTGKPLEWNGEDMKFANNDEANALLKRDYREGWALG